jgi:putative NIF3 family GTP cyclohydrolase 1 type 2
MKTRVKIEVVFQQWLQTAVVNAMLAAHPYEEPAYDIIQIDNSLATTGSGLIGELEMPMKEEELLHYIKKQFGLEVIKHTALAGKPVQKIAVCGGAGSFLIKPAIASGADFYITSDVKYHEFFDAEKQARYCRYRALRKRTVHDQPAF